MKTKLFQILGVAAVATIGMASCDTDPCSEVECGDYGTCLEGACVCDAGFEGDDCATMSRDKFVGTYLASGTATCPVSGNGTFDNVTTTVGISSTGADRATFDFGGAVLLTCTVNGNDITVVNATVDGFNYSGSGSLNASGTTLTMTLNEEEPGVETCVYAITAQKQ